MSTSISADILVIGSANIDFISKADRIPRVGESVTNAQFNQAFGGKGANQAVAAARSLVGASPGSPVAGRVAFVASVGNDQFGTDMLSSWSECGINASLVRRAGEHTGCALIMIGNDGDNSIMAAPEANDLLLPEHIDELKPAISGAKYVLMQFEVPESTTERVLHVAEEVDVPVVWNVAPMRAIRRDLVGMAGIVVVNETEAELISGVEVPDAASAAVAGREILGLGCSAVIVTLGESGSLVVTQSGESHVPAFSVQAVDTTAAGDTYCGCLVTALSEGLPLDEAVRFASAGAAISVGRLGAQPSVPWRSEVDAFLAQRTG